MRVECDTIEAFLEELAIEAEEGRVWKNIVRVETRRHAEQDEEQTFKIGFNASALIGDRGGEVNELLHFDGFAGADGYHRRNGERCDPEAGSKKAAEWDKTVRELATGKGLQVRPGKYELV